MLSGSMVIVREKSVELSMNLQNIQRGCVGWVMSIRATFLP